MAAVLAFGLTLLVAVLISELARRTVLSTAVLFLAVGFILGSGVAGVVVLAPGHDVMARFAELALFAESALFAELALFSVLFTDGMRLGGRDIRSAWPPPPASAQRREWRERRAGAAVRGGAPRRRHPT